MAVARARISGVQRGSCPFAGFGVSPKLSLFSSRPQGAKRLCNSPGKEGERFDRQY